MFNSSTLVVGRADLVDVERGCDQTRLILDITCLLSKRSSLSPRALLMIFLVAADVPSAPVGMNRGSVMMPSSSSILVASVSSGFMLLSVTTARVFSKRFLVLLIARSHSA